MALKRNLWIKIEEYFNNFRILIFNGLLSRRIYKWIFAECIFLQNGNGIIL